MGDEGVRLDKVVASHFTDISRTRISNLIEQKMITVNGKLPKGKDKVKAGDIVSVTLPEVREAEVLPEDIPLDILYEDEDVLVVNKPKGMVVHPAPGHMNGTLVNACLFHCGDLSGINGVLRPGIVHRIDMDTTGSVIVCKNDRAHRAIADELKEHKIVRKYDAIVCGVMREAQGTVNAPLGRSKRDRKKMAVDPSGKRAVTHYVVREQFRDCAWLSLQLETGRTHQIRVHMAYINRPVLGDGIYGGGGALRVSESLKLDGQCLHARVLGFHQPTTGEYIETQAPLPEYFENLLKRFRRE
ncbi:MAG: RluA family pseudouridine synthase [Lachnospiraceae bacterium]|nr:RluA family pseudouridine synthase [Lachnospiraceae bacterium]